MSHTPFILASYAVGTVVLAWCAFSPWLQRKKTERDIRRLIQIEERSRDANT